MPTPQELLAESALRTVSLQTKAVGAVNLLNYVPYSHDAFQEQLAHKMALKESYDRCMAEHYARYGTGFSSQDSFENLVSLVSAFGGGDCVGLSYLALDCLNLKGAMYPRIVNFYLKGEGVAHCCVAFNSPALLYAGSTIERDIFRLEGALLREMVIVEPWLNFYCYAGDYFSRLEASVNGQALCSFNGEKYGRMTAALKEYRKIVLGNPFHEDAVAEHISLSNMPSRKRARNLSAEPVKVVKSKLAASQ